MKPIEQYKPNVFSHSKHVIFSWESGDNFDN